MSNKLCNQISCHDDYASTASETPKQAVHNNFFNLTLCMNWPCFHDPVTSPPELSLPQMTPVGDYPAKSRKAEVIIALTKCL